MPGLVAPSEASPPRIPIPPEDQNGGTATQTSNQKATPSPSTPAPKNTRPSPSKKKSPNLDSDSTALDNPDLGPFLLKLARDTIASGDGPGKALEYAIRASKSFERCAELEVEGGPQDQGKGDKLKLELAMSLHVTAAIYCSLGRFDEAVPILERAIGVPNEENGASDHALAKFSGCMQLGDTYSMLGRVDQSIACYTDGLKIQMEALGENDPRVAETCRFL